LKPPADQELIDLAEQTPVKVEEAMDALDISGALSALWRLVGRANKYVDETAPWGLAKEPARRQRLATVMYNLAECLRFITVIAAPFMPLLPPRVWSQLGLDDREDVHTWNSLVWGKFPDGVKVKRTEALFPRIEV
jgi:methionyl-tRNA synthetase